MKTSRPIKMISWRAAIIMLLTLIGAAAASQAIEAADRNPHWARPLQLPGAENFYEVTPDLYRAAQPTWEAMRSYEAFGIKTVINLRSRHSDRELMVGLNLNLIEVPVKTWDIEDREVIAILRLIESQPKPVLIHCQHGADRTGLMIAMYRLVFEGWTKEEALDELLNGGYGFHRIWRNIPEYIQEVDLDAVRRGLK